jgi:hypothetical protein
MTIFEAQLANGTLADFTRPPGSFTITAIDRDAGLITFSGDWPAK